jgi:carboxyl-terminal processing protease
LNTPLVGNKSFGKGSVQEMIGLDNGTSLKITVAEWKTPKGTSINKQGLNPDVLVNYGAETSINNQLDPQLKKAVELIKSNLKK